MGFAIDAYFRQCVGDYIYVSPAVASKGLLCDTILCNLAVFSIPINYGTQGETIYIMLHLLLRIKQMRY